MNEPLPAERLQTSLDFRRQCQSLYNAKYIPDKLACQALVSRLESPLFESSDQTHAAQVHERACKLWAGRTQRDALRAGRKRKLADFYLMIPIPAAGPGNFAVQFFPSSRDREGVAGDGIIAGPIQPDIKLARIGQLESPDDIVIYGMPMTDIAEGSLEENLVAVNLGIHGQEGNSAVGGFDDRRRVSFKRLGTSAGCPQVGNDVGEILCRQILFEADRHQ